jgi:hypothetical protein
MCSSTRSKPASSAMVVARTKSRTLTWSMSARSSRGAPGRMPSDRRERRGREERPGALRSRGWSMPSHRREHVEPLRPACASCMPILAGECLWTKSTMRFQAAACLVVYMPAQPGVMRPSAETSVISVITRPAPPMARLPRCTRCQSSTVPSSAEYMAHGLRRPRGSGCSELAQAQRREHGRRRGAPAGGTPLWKGRRFSAKCSRSTAPRAPGRASPGSRG